jgi:uncharacterized protein
MLRDLEYLVQLQEIDQRIYEQELAKEQLPATVNELEQTVAKAKTAMETAAKKLAEVEATFQSSEDQVANAHTMLDKSQERLSSIKTNREYDAVHAEIEAQKGIIHSSESRRKKLTDEIEQLKAQADAAAQEYEKIKGENEPKLTELRAQIDAIDTVIAGIEKERVAVTPQIAKSTMRTYDLIRNRRKHGKVISIVSEDRLCTTCFKVLERQLVNEIKRSTKIILCQNCGSIFVWSPKPKDEQ